MKSNTITGWLVFLLYSLILLVGFVLCLLAAGCSGPCHSGHTTVEYVAAYTTFHTECLSHDKKGNCTWTHSYTVHHPEHCSSSWTCDLWCKDLDKGKSEAHPAHPVQTSVLVADSRCTRQGELK